MQTIGERLEEARKKKGVSIREAAEATKVRGEYLQKFEANQFDLGLGDLYVRGFLRSYAIYLKIPADRVLADFAALGHGESRPRQPSREVYGRMDLSIASSDEEGPREKAGGEDAPAAREPGAEAPRQVHHVPRSRAGTPMETGINQALVYKGIIAGAGLVVLLLILLIVKSLMSGPAAPQESPRPAPAAASLV
jgi:cytoskeleton protein RodZ